MRFAAIPLLAATLWVAVHAGVAIAGAPTPTTVPTPARTPVPTVALLQIGVPLSNDDPIIGWEQFPNATRYRLTGEARAVRINAADAFCTPPLEPQESVITVNETFGDGTTEYRIPFPTIDPEDQWFIYSIRIEVDALDAQGNVIANAGAAGIGETNAICPTETPPLSLPATGAGAGDGAALPPWPLVLLGLAGLALGAGGAMRWRA